MVATTIERDEVSVLGDELIYLSVKCSKVVPAKKPLLICSFWTKKSFNPDNLRAQLKIIWKTKKKFEIKLAGQNLFLITFENVDDLEFVLEDSPWHFIGN